MSTTGDASKTSKSPTSHRKCTSRMAGMFLFCSTCLHTSSSTEKKVQIAPPTNEILQTRKSLDRYERIGNLLEQFLKGKLQHIHKFTDLPDGYFLIDEIIQLPEFKKEHCTYDEIIDVVHNDALLRFSVRGSKVRLKPPELNKDPDVILSKKLAWILRHGAENVGMKYEPGGYLYVDKILQLKPFQGVRLEDISRVVNSNDKKRYELSTNPENGLLRIRAYQGHTVTFTVRQFALYCFAAIKLLRRVWKHVKIISKLGSRPIKYNTRSILHLVQNTTFSLDIYMARPHKTQYNPNNLFAFFNLTIEGLDIALIENPEDYPTVIHGTYFRNWDSIRKEGLKRMQRTHIHFAPGEVGETGVISGMRSSAEIIIYIDLIKAINDGYKFYISKNNVILCEGNKEGCLPTTYFRAAYQRNPRLKLSLTP
ncbi:hypothetical protein Smp_037640 [Schistosoma mansoni]|uniref:hypothetical protein n=1 Tax=Schistosoma mansoni TaxID=6183 RepID=UPI00022DC1FB|nr:hypothetical protein Smp_037640 [Schistosoma mansoni]|eukprot:XP_018649737.1 hypothetical protein Smp_037640 [Schistosoma mansoni]